MPCEIVKPPSKGCLLLSQPCVDYRTYTRCEEFDATEAIWVEESHLRSFIIGLIPENLLLTRFSPIEKSMKFLVVTGVIAFVAFPKS